MSKLLNLFKNSTNKYKYDDYIEIEEKKTIIKSITIDGTKIHVIPCSLEKKYFNYTFFEKLDGLDTENNIYLFKETMEDEIYIRLNYLNLKFKSDWYVAPKIYIELITIDFLNIIVKWILVQKYSKCLKLPDFYFICKDEYVQNIINKLNVASKITIAFVECNHAENLATYNSTSQ